MHHVFHFAPIPSHLWRIWNFASVDILQRLPTCRLNGRNEPGYNQISKTTLHCIRFDLTFKLFFSILSFSLFCLSHFLTAHCICCVQYSQWKWRRQRNEFGFRAFQSNSASTKEFSPLLTGCNIPNGSGPQRTESGFTLYNIQLLKTADQFSAPAQNTYFAFYINIRPSFKTFNNIFFGNTILKS